VIKEGTSNDRPWSGSRPTEHEVFRLISITELRLAQGFRLSATATYQWVRRSSICTRPRSKCTFGRGCDGVCCQEGRPPVDPEEIKNIEANSSRFLPQLRCAAHSIVVQSGFLLRGSVGLAGVSSGLSQFTINSIAFCTSSSAMPPMEAAFRAPAELGHDVEGRLLGHSPESTVPASSHYTYGSSRKLLPRFDKSAA
jgi:hypothetical protein